MKERPGFMLYFAETEAAFSSLTDDEAGVLFKAILLFAKNGEVTVFEDRLLRILFDTLCLRIAEDQARYEKKCQAATDNINRRWKKQQEQKKNTDNTVEYGRIQSNTDDTNNNNNYNNNSTTITTQPFYPTIAEFRDFCADHAPHVDADEFFDRYASLSWTDGNGQPIRNWKNVVLSAERKGKEKAEKAERQAAKKEERTVTPEDLVQLPNGEFCPRWEFEERMKAGDPDG